MKKILAVLLASLLLLPALALAEGCEISANGTATITAQPDIVSVDVTAEVTSATIADAQQKISEIAANATKALLDLGVAEQDIVTINYNYSPTYDYSGDTPRQTGYQAYHSLHVTCRDVDMLDAVLAAATDNGMTQVYGVNFDVSNRTELYRQALAMAVEAAGEKAAKLAEPLGLTKLTPKCVTENGGYDYGVYANAVADRTEAVMAAGSAGIRSGDISVSASVNVVYEAEE